MADVSVASTVGTKRYAVVGTGSRAEMYVRAIAGDLREHAVLVGLCDTNPGRVSYHRALAAGLLPASEAVATFTPEDFPSAIRLLAIDRVIITSPDFTHARYIVEALHAGADVIVEKPLTIDVAGCRAIARAIEETGRDVVVTFNYRYSPRNSALKEVVQSGEIGTVTSVEFSWLLDTVHGADYFRRWHRDKANSGGLLVHKASHHFDLVNWWIADTPARVFASGGLRFYGDRNAEVATAAGDRRLFDLDLSRDDRLRRLYLENQSLDGYHRDQDVFGTGITIEDNLALVVDYDRGPTLSYSLNAHSPWEGYHVAINGTEGRAELDVIERSSVVPDENGLVVDPGVDAASDDDEVRRLGARLVVQRHWEHAREVSIGGEHDGAHGGGDVRMLSDIFAGAADDPLGRPSGHLDGVRAVAVGIAGNESLATGAAVTVASLGLGFDLSR